MKLGIGKNVVYSCAGPLASKVVTDASGKVLSKEKRAICLWQQAANGQFQSRLNSSHVCTQGAFVEGHYKRRTIEVSLLPGYLAVSPLVLDFKNSTKSSATLKSAMNKDQSYKDIVIDSGLMALYLEFINNLNLRIVFLELIEDKKQLKPSINNFGLDAEEIKQANKLVKCPCGKDLGLEDPVSPAYYYYYNILFVFPLLTSFFFPLFFPLFVSIFFSIFFLSFFFFYFFWCSSSSSLLFLFFFL